MKLLYIHSTPLESRQANLIQVLQMCNAFANLGLEVCLAVPGEGDDSDDNRGVVRKKIGKEPDFTIRSFGAFAVAGRLQMVGGYAGVWRLLGRQKADWCFIRNPVFVNAALWHGLHTVFESHDATIHDNFLWDIFWKRLLVKDSRNPRLLKFIAISQSLADRWVSRGVPRQKVMALHDAVDAEAFSSVPDAPSGREELNLPANRKVLVYAGSLYADRGVGRVLELAREFRDAYFVVVGGPNDRVGHYMRQAELDALRNIRFVGQVPHAQVKRYLIAADVLLMLWNKKVRTINFCSPLKLFEYMGAGRIIVGDAFPTIREVLTDRENALLVEPESLEEMREAIGRALRMSYPCAMAAAARELALAMYSWDIRVRKIWEAIEESLRNRGQPPAGGFPKRSRV